MESRRLGKTVVSSLTDRLSRKLFLRAGQSKRFRAIWVSMLVAVLMASTWAAIAATYIYDANGRLVVAVNDTGASAQYVYDNMGNLSKIIRLSATDLAIFSFSPGKGGPGVVVTVIGQGFSSTAGQNLVKFNGTVAAVSSALATKLTVIVPSGATTGRITVQVGAVTATSATNFVVDNNIRPPTITDVSPPVVAVGSPVTVTGQYLAPVANQTGVALNAHPVLTTTLTDTQAVFSVPAGTGSGKVRVTTPYGVATSAGDVVVAPSGVNAADIVQVKRLVADVAAQGFSISTTGQYAAALFDASNGDYINLQFSNISVTGISYDLYSTDNTHLTGGTVSPSSPTVLLPKLTTSGTYLLLMKPDSGPATWGLAIEKSPSIVVDGAVVSVATTAPGQQERLFFSANANQSLILWLGELTSNSSSPIHVSVYQPDGPLLKSSDCTLESTGCGINLSSPMAGLYKVIVAPGATQTMSFKAAVSSELAGVLTDGNSLSFATTRLGQTVALTFTATANQNLGLGISDLLTPGVTVNETTPNGASVQVLRSNGSLVGQQNCFAWHNGCQLNLQSLSAGTYKVLIAPPINGVGTMSFTATLSSDQTAMTGSDVDVSLALSLPGQNSRLSFMGAAGQMGSLHVSNQSTTPAGREVYYRVYAPDGGLLTSISIVSASGTLVFPQLTQTGIYTVFVDPTYGETMTATVKLTGVDQMGQIVPDGQVVDFTTTVAGQRVLLDFVANSGANLGLGLTQLTQGVSGAAYMEIRKSDGTYVWGDACSVEQNYGCGANLRNLAAGTYRATITSVGGNSTMSFRAALTSELTGVLQRDVLTPVSLTRNGQSARFTFSADAGEYLTLRFDQQTSSPANAVVSYDVYAQSGQLVATYDSSGPVTLEASSLPETGDYVVTVSTGYGETLTLQALLASSQTSTLVVDGATDSIATSIPGQSVFLTFTTSSAADLGLGISELATPGTTEGVRFELRMADGTYVTEVTCLASNGGCQLNLPGLAAGTYRLEATPPPPEGERTMSFKATLSTDLVATLPLDTAYTLNLPRPGQNAQLSFSGTAGSSLKLAVTGQTTVPSGGRVYYTVSGPSGFYASTSTLNAIEFNLPTLPGTGTYTMFIDPRYGETLSTQIAIGAGANIVGTLSVDGSTNAYTTLFQGQQVSLTFTATAGANLGLGISDLNTPGTTGAANIQVNKPNGTLYSNTSCRAPNGGCGVNLSGLVAGTYSVVISPPTTGQKTMSFKVTLSTDQPGTMTLGNPLAVSLTRRGQDGRFTYSGTAGQKLSLAIASQATTPAGGLAYYRVYRPAPDGTQLIGGSTTSTTTITVPVLPTTGTYSITVDPQYGETLSSQATLQTR